MHHSSYYIDHSEPPAPMLMSSGFTDDLFPADETIRYYNRTKTEYPDADLALFFGDFGHPRAQNKSDVTGALQRTRSTPGSTTTSRARASSPQQGVEAYTETCPDSAPSGGPYARRQLGDRSRRARSASATTRTKTIAADSTTGGVVQPGHERAPAPPRRPTTRRAPRPTSSMPRPQAATR